jgi:hypothetical protein
MLGAWCGAAAVETSRTFGDLMHIGPVAGRAGGEGNF